MRRGSRSLKHWLSGAVGIVLVLAYGWAAAQSDPGDPGGVYLLRIGFLAGALGAMVVGTLDRLELWSFTVPRVLAVSALAAAAFGPLLASVLSIDGLRRYGLFEWLEFGVLSGFTFALMLYGWRGRMSEVGDE